MKLVGRIRRLRRSRQPLCLIALRLSGLQNYRPGMKLVGRIKRLHRIRLRLCLMALRLSGLRNYRPGIKLVGRIRCLRRIRQPLCLMALRLSAPTKLQNMHKACRPDKALAPHPAKRIRAASVSGVYLPATCSLPADKRRRPDNKSVNPAASRPDTPYSSALY